MLDLLQAHGRLYELGPGRPQAMAASPGLRTAQKPATRVRFGDRHAALRFLREVVARDAGKLRALRSTIPTLPSQSDDDVLEAVAAALATARLSVYARPRPQPVVHVRREEIVE